MKHLVTAVALLLPIVAEAVDPRVTPDFTTRRAVIRSAFARPADVAPAAKPLPPVGLLGKEQFRQFGAAWAQFHRSVATGSVDILRTVVRNARSCRNDALAVRAEMLMESRARMSLGDGPVEKSMGELILEAGPKVLPEQFGEAAVPFVVQGADPAIRVRFGNAVFVEGDNGHWSVDLGC